MIHWTRNLGRDAAFLFPIRAGLATILDAQMIGLVL
jgi:hypothetical protein